MKNFITSLLSRGGISSKRMCGILGWITSLFIAIYCSVNGVDSPAMMTEVMGFSTALLGLDTVTDIVRSAKGTTTTEETKEEEETE